MRHLTVLRLHLQALQHIFVERRSFQPVARFWLRSLLHPAATARLLRHFARHPGIWPSRRVRVDSLLKLGREHVRCGLNADERADLLITHHATLSRGLGAAAFAKVLDGSPVRLASLTGQDPSACYDLWLRQAPFGYRREGESTLSVMPCAAGPSLADVTFTFGRMPSGSTCLRIGGFQGPPPPAGKAAVKAATKALDGLRPKAVAMEAVYHLCYFFGADTVLATSLACHVLHGRKADIMRRAPYDGFWEELGGIRLASGDYLLPPTPPHRNAADVPGKRLRDWERRRQRLATLASDIDDTLTALRRQGSPPATGMLPDCQAAAAYVRVPSLRHVSPRPELQD